MDGYNVLFYNVLTCRRSTRIQENEQREMAERIRQENLQKEQEALKSCEKCEELDKQTRRVSYLSSYKC